MHKSAQGTDRIAAATQTSAGSYVGGRPTRAEAERRINHLLDIALREFASRGFGATSLDRLVALSGVSKTTMIRRFGNKEGMFRVLMARNVALVQANVWSLNMDPDDPQGTLERLTQAFVRTAVRSPLANSLLRLAIVEQCNFPILGKTLLSHAAQGMQPLADFLEILMDRGLLRRTDPLEAAFDFQGLATQGFRSLFDKSDHLDDPARAAAIARRFLRGWGA